MRRLAVVLLVCVLALGPGFSALAQVPPPPVPDDGVLFSAPVPDLFPGEPVRTCTIGIFGGPRMLPLEHHWKLLSRGSGLRIIRLEVGAVSVNSIEEAGSIEVTLSDENGLRSIAVAHPPTNDTAFGVLELTVLGGEIYPFTVRALSPSDPRFRRARHYTIGAVERFELGWGLPLHYLEHGGNRWAIHVEPGPTALVLSVDPRGIGDVPNQAETVMFGVEDTLGGIVVPGTSSGIDPFSPVVIGFSSAVSETLIVSESGDGHHLLQNLSRSDRGFYVLPCSEEPKELIGALDVKPGSCPNPFNVGSGGVLPIAIVGTAVFDASAVDTATLLLMGVVPLRFSVADAATPFPLPPNPGERDCTDARGDGVQDLVLHFDHRAVADALPVVADGQVFVLELTGNLKPEFGGTRFVARDVIQIIKKR